MGLQIGEIITKREISFSDLKGKTIAVDAFNAIYQFLTTIRQPDGTPLKDSKGNITSHLSGLFYRNMNLISEGIKIIYVFDGKAPELKKRTQEIRMDAKDEARQKYKEAMEREDIEAMGKKLAQELPYYTVRNLIKPGLSGWAQIKQETEPHHGVDIDGTRTKFSYDLFYIKNMSWVLDSLIILETIKTVLVKKGS